MDVLVKTTNPTALIRAMTKHGAELVHPTDEKGVYRLSGDPVTQEVISDLEESGLITVLETA